MARPNKIPKDPAVYAQLIEDLAFGINTRLIGEAIGVPDETIRGWKRRPDFKRDLAVKTLEILRDPIKRVHEGPALAFLQVHPETKEAFAPPAQNVKGSLELIIRDAVKDGE